MKKLLMFLCCVLMINGAWAASETTCSESSLYLEDNQNFQDDEFLYRNKLEYEKAENGIKNSTARSGGDAMVYECDRSSRKSNCGNRSVVTLEAGHYYKGKLVNHKETYTCWTNNLVHWNDRWVPGNSQCRIQNTSIPVGESYEKTLTLAQCSGLRISDEARGVEFTAVCEEGPVARCIAIKCIDGFEPDANGICDRVVQNTPSCTNIQEKEACLAKPLDADWNEDKCSCTCKAGKGTWNTNKFVCEREEVSGKSCRETRQTPEGKACCDVPNAKWDGQHCSCERANEKFEIYNTNHGRCVVIGDDNGDTTLFECPSNRITVDASACPAAASALVDLTLYCENDKTRNAQGYKERFDKVNAELQKCKQAADKDSKAKDLAQRIKQRAEGMAAKLTGWDADLSVWKTAEGNFNGARLASDSIAGVVLGTAGGLITSNVVKKSQVKSGFEDIQCTIGGQKVADWGDEFTVGIR